MSAAFYTEMADLAASLLEEFGGALTLTRDTTEVIQMTSMDLATAGSDTTYTPFGLFLDISDDLIDGTTIRAGDRMVYLDNTVEPMLDDRITFEGEEWAITRVSKIKPSSVAVLYKCMVRG